MDVCACPHPDEHLRTVRDTVATHGWAVQAVLGDEKGPAFSYTIGLTRHHGHPEVIVTGLGASGAGHLLNHVGRLVAAGHRLRAGGPIEFAGVDHLLLDVVEGMDWFVFANALYAAPGAPPLTGLQLVWPDVRGLLPWEAGGTLDPDRQPLLGPPPGWVRDES